jgi:hypothetical protein
MAMTAILYSLEISMKESIGRSRGIVNLGRRAIAFGM